MYDTFDGFTKFAEFAAEDGHLYMTLDAEDTTLRKRVLSHDELQPWLVEQRADTTLPNTPNLPRLRLLPSDSRSIARPWKLASPHRQDFPLTLQTLHDIVDAFELPKPFVNFAICHSTVAMNFDGSDLTGLQADMPSATGVIAIQSSLALAVSTDAKTNVTSAVALGLCPHQTMQLEEAIKSSLALLGLPMVLPIAWLHVLGQTRARRVSGRKDAVVETELELGVHWSSTGVPMARKQPRGVDYDLLTRRLTVIGSELGWDTHAIDSQLDMAKAIESYHDELNTRSPRDPFSIASAALCRSRLRQAKQQLAGSQRWTAYSMQRVQVQLQTVYSLISQRDNEISYATAVASQRIAEAAQRDNVIMKHLSEDSRHISLRAWRDSIDMRIMAAVTLFTLPGTFVATFFSTSFFNFQSSADGSVVSSWIWLYGASTVGLTAFFMIVWYLANRTMSRRIGSMTSASLISDNDGKSLTEPVSRLYTSKEVNKMPAERPQAYKATTAVSSGPLDGHSLFADSGMTMSENDDLPVAVADAGPPGYETVGVGGIKDLSSSAQTCARCAALL